MGTIIENQNNETSDNIDWDDPSWDEEEYLPFSEDPESNDWHAYSYIDAMQKLCDAYKEATSYGLFTFLKKGDDIAEKIKKPEYQNAQVSLEIPAIIHGGKYGEQIELIRKMERKGKYNELLGMCEDFFNELEEKLQVGDIEKEYSIEETLLIEKNCRLAIICCKIAAEHGNPIALWLLGECFLQGLGLPHNPHIANAIFSRLEKPMRECNAELVDSDMEYLQTCLEFEKQEYAPYKRGNQYRFYAKSMEQEHYPEEEWLLYEYYYTSSYKADQGKQVKPARKFKDKFYAKRVDWEDLLAMPWEKIFAGKRVIDKKRIKQTIERIYQAMKALFLPDSNQQEAVPLHNSPEHSITHNTTYVQYSAKSQTPEENLDDELWDLAHEEEERLHEEYLAEMDYWYNGPGNEYYSHVTGQVEEPSYFEDHPDEYRG